MGINENICCENVEQKSIHHVGAVLSNASVAENIQVLNTSRNLRLDKLIETKKSPLYILSLHKATSAV